MGVVMTGTSEGVVRRARIDKLATDVFGSNVKAHRWLREPKVFLGGKSPLACLATDEGTRAVEDALNQIDHGILP
jgi:putative toxin-antitoxin system antitoxin component (TIGR02293 family)